jgi:hypothetical protein
MFGLLALLLYARGAPCATVRDRPGTAYYLNEEQALYACTLSRTEKSHQVRVMLIMVFTSYRRGGLVPQYQLPLITCLP